MYRIKQEHKMFLWGTPVQETPMTAAAQPQQPPRLQPLLFTELPQSLSEKTLRRQKAGKRRSNDENVVAPITDDFLPPPPQKTEAAEFTPAALSHAELRALLEALPDSKLAFVLLEAARDIKRRVMPAEADFDGDVPPEPNLALLRAAAAAAAELSGEDDAPAAVMRPDAKRGAKKSSRPVPATEFID
jgi:hypothetical protein